MQLYIIGDGEFADRIKIMLKNVRCSKKGTHLFVCANIQCSGQ